MPSYPQSIPLDLDRYSEAVRRQLYNAIRLSCFWTEGGDPDSTGALYSAEAAELRIFFLGGRWFAMWRRLEVSSNEPEAMRTELLRIKAGDTPEGWVLSEC